MTQETSIGKFSIEPDEIWQYSRGCIFTIDQLRRRFQWDFFSVPSRFDKAEQNMNKKNAVICYKKKLT